LVGISGKYPDTDPSLDSSRENRTKTYCRWGLQMTALPSAEERLDYIRLAPLSPPEKCRKQDNRPVKEFRCTMNLVGQRE
jgi:hypothetical protein